MIENSKPIMNYRKSLTGSRNSLLTAALLAIAVNAESADTPIALKPAFNAVIAEAMKNP
jgi:hypothetical protein